MDAVTRVSQDRSAPAAWAVRQALVLSLRWYLLALTGAVMLPLLP